MFDMVIPTLIAALSSVIVVSAAFVGLNSCTATSTIQIRLTLVMAFTAGNAILIMVLSGVPVSWPTAISQLALAAFLVCNRRNQNPLQIHNHQRKH